MSHFHQDNIDALAVSAIKAATYLDACDTGALAANLDPRCYQACGNVLRQIFALLDPETNFPVLLEQSAAARELAESIKIDRHIEISRLGYFPELTIVLNRVSV